MDPQPTSRRAFCKLTLGALGVVYGDIGTSPLYALRECFHGQHAIAASPQNILGVVSLILWSLVLLVSVKYLSLVMRADNKGEGGILSLLVLAFPDRANLGRKRAILFGLGIFGAALLYGDGVITPSMTVLSAVEGLEVATDFFTPYIVPLTVLILVAMFSVQRIGTGKVGITFGPVMVTWFVTLSALGVRGIVQAPEVVAALNPLLGLRFLWSNGWMAFLVLGAVFLAVTGAEALYADMGHFGIRSIRLAWFSLVLPALMLNYFGQAALLVRNPAAAENPFYNLAPIWGRYPLVVLATMAAVIASQALISGAFSLTMQAVQLGYLPRMAINHTSSHQRGQIFVPQANRALMFACILLVLGFGSSTGLAAAYGIAVSMTMLITTMLFYFAARRLWGWSALKLGALLGVVFTVELAFCAANLMKVRQGGWVPLVLGAGLFTIMATWQKGRRLLGEKLRAVSLPLDMFLEDVAQHPPVRVPGTAIFMAGNPQGTPIALLHNLKHNKILHQRTVFLNLSAQEVAHVDPSARVQVEKLPGGFYRVRAVYGFMDEPDVPGLLAACAPHGLEFKLHDTTFFLSSETILPSRHPSMPLWREWLFALLARNAQRATAFFRLPANRVVELGMQVEM